MSARLNLGELHPAHAPRIECEVRKTHYTHPIRMLNAEQCIIREVSLQQTYKATTHDHHDEQACAFIGVFA
jgi:hypothetical protein